MISQVEANNLLRMPKEFENMEAIPFSKGFVFDRHFDVRSSDHREKFIFTMSRGKRRKAKLKYQTRARKIIVLARLDMHGPAHKNPEHSDYRPDERIPCPHIHLYREGFEDKIAYYPHETPDFSITDITDDISWLQDFFKFCNIENPPSIQEEL